MKRSKRKDRISIYWPIWILVTLCGFLSFFLICVGFIDSDRSRTRLLVSGVMSLPLIVYFSKNIVLTEKAIEVRYLFWRRRRIPWTHITQIGVVSYKKKMAQEEKNIFRIDIYYVLFTLQNCPLFDPQKDEWRKFTAEHPELSFEMMLPAKKEMKYVRLIERYYGSLDYGVDEIVLKNNPRN